MHPLRSLSADLRAHLRSGLSGLELAKPSSRPASVPALGDVTRNILGVKTGGGEEDEDSAYQDPNTDSLRSRPKSSARGGVGLGPPVPSVPQPGGGPRAAASPPTKLAGAGAGQLPASPVRNLFPDTGRTQSRSSTLVDAESLQEDKSESWTRSSSVFTVQFTVLTGNMFQVRHSSRCRWICPRPGPRSVMTMFPAEMSPT